MLSTEKGRERLIKGLKRPTCCWKAVCRRAMESDQVEKLALRLARRAREACGREEVALTLELGSRKEVARRATFIVSHRFLMV